VAFRPNFTAGLAKAVSIIKLIFLKTAEAKCLIFLKHYKKGSNLNGNKI